MKKRNHTVLTPTKVRLIKDLLKFNTQTEIAKQFGVCRAVINRIANKRTWVDI